MDPTRRAIVVGLGTVAAALAGCVDGTSGPSEADTPAPGGGNGTGNGEGTESDNGDGNPEDDTPVPPHTSEYHLTVESIDRETVLARLDVASLDDQPDEVREAVRAAIDGRYESDAVPDALRRFVATENQVHVEGSIYALEANFPQEVLSLTEVDASTVDRSNVVGADRFRRDADAADAISTAIADGELRRASFSEFLHDLVAEFDYVTPTDPDDATADVYAWTIEEAEGDPPYWLEATERDREAVYGDDVVAFDSLSADAQSEIDRALAEDGLTLEESPAVLEDDRSLRFVVIDEEYYAVRISVAN